MLLVAVGLYSTNADNRATAAVAEQGLVTDRFIRATDQLGSDKIDVRLGAIYSLQRLMNDSPSDFVTIIAVLGAYVRDQAPRLKQPPAQGLATDVQATLTVLGKSHASTHGTYIDLSATTLAFAYLDSADLAGANLAGADLFRAYLFRAYLSGAFLYGASLTGTTLSSADLHGANLTEANLNIANLTDADLTGVNLRRATLNVTNLTGANLSSADLYGADLTHADLTDANLVGADLGGADLTDANLSGADLRAADLRGANLTSIVWSPTTAFPPGTVLPTPKPS